MTKYIRSTLIQVLKGNNILLGMKKRGFGKGKYNGFGGKLQENETVKQAAIRELYEESNLIAKEKDIEQIAILLFEFVGDDFIMEVNVFKTHVYSGNEKESDEMKPIWFSFDEIPYSQMWADDEFWFPLMFKGKHFFGFFQFKGQQKMLSQKITITESENELVSLLHERQKSLGVPLTWPS